VNADAFDFAGSYRYFKIERNGFLPIKKTRKAQNRSFFNLQNRSNIKSKSKT